MQQSWSKYCRPCIFGSLFLTIFFNKSIFSWVFTFLVKLYEESSLKSLILRFISGLWDILILHSYCFGFTNFSRCLFLLQFVHSGLWDFFRLLLFHEFLKISFLVTSYNFTKLYQEKTYRNFLRPNQYEWRMKMSQRPEIPRRFYWN